MSRPAKWTRCDSDTDAVAFEIVPVRLGIKPATIRPQMEQMAKNERRKVENDEAALT